jgi:hypothetical protein
LDATADADDDAHRTPSLQTDLHAPKSPSHEPIHTPPATGARHAVAYRSLAAARRSERLEDKRRTAVAFAGAEWGRGKWGYFEGGGAGDAGGGRDAGVAGWAGGVGGAGGGGEEEEGGEEEMRVMVVSCIAWALEAGSMMFFVR